MKTRPSSITLLLTCAVMTACAVPQGSDTVRGGRIPLAESQSIALARDIILRYDSVNDSRCPHDARCIWAGTVRYHFTLRSNGGTESFQLGDEQREYVSAALHGVKVELAEEKPPAPTRPNARAAYHPVTLNIVVR